MGEKLTERQVAVMRRARASNPFACTTALTVSAPDEETVKTIAVFVRTLNTTDLRAQGWTE